MLEFTEANTKILVICEAQTWQKATCQDPNKERIVITDNTIGCWRKRSGSNTLHIKGLTRYWKIALMNFATD